MILGTTKSGKVIHDSFQENEKLNYTLDDHRDAYRAMNIQRAKAEANHLQGEILALDDRRYFGEEARKHFRQINP